MGRAERRRLEKQKGKQVKTYNLTRSQLHNAVRQVTEEDLKRIKQEAMEDAINTAMTLLLVLPMEVLMDHYWKKTYAKKIPEFTELVLQYYERWQNGELDMDEMKKDLWEYGGVRFRFRFRAITLRGSGCRWMPLPRASILKVSPTPVRWAVS